MIEHAGPAYDKPVIALHWLMAAGIVGVFSLGLYMTSLSFSPDKLRYYSWHKWGGVTIFMLAIVRVAYRLFWHKAWEMKLLAASALPRWQELTARGAHYLLYLLLVAIPLSGWLMSSAKGVSTVYLGLWPLPDLIGKNAELGMSLLDVHVFLNWLMAFLVAAHVGAALKHHFIDRDGVLSRMLPWVGIRSSRRAP